MLGYGVKPGGKPNGDVYILERENLEKATSSKKIYKERRIAIAQVHTVKTPTPIENPSTISL